MGVQAVEASQDEQDVQYYRHRCCGEENKQLFRAIPALFWTSYLTSFAS